MSLDSEHWIPSPKNLFQIVVQHFRPPLQEYVGAPFLAARNHGPYRSHRTNARFLPKAGSLIIANAEDKGLAGNESYVGTKNS